MSTHTDIPAADSPEVRATAWALDQMTPAERSAFAAELATDPALRARAEEMREFCQVMHSEFPADESAGRLPDECRASVLAALTSAPEPANIVRPGFLRRHWKAIGFAAAAAGVTLAVFPRNLPPPGTLSGTQSRTELSPRPTPPPPAAQAGLLAKTDRAKTLEALRESENEPQEAAAPTMRLAAATATDGKAESLVAPEMPKPLFAGTPLPNRGLERQSTAPAPVPAYDHLYADNAQLYLKTTSLESKVREEARHRQLTSYLYRLAETGTDATSNTEAYQSVPVSTFLAVAQQPLSTFSIDVDTAGYSNMRRFLNSGSAPPPEAVRVEEMVNYFPYHYAPPVDGKPFAVHVETTAAPWDATHRIARVGLKGKEIANGERPASNLVFLVDVSGSMSDANKLPLVQQSLRLLIEGLGENDRVALVVYAGNSGVVLPSTNGQDKPRILSAIQSLQSGGSTNGASGIEMAYQQAAANFIPGGVNRVILATDGDFNVGATSQDALQQLITDKAKSGVFLSVLGYGMGNLKDNTMEMLADKGNGNYAYIDSLSEARKALVEQMNGTLVTIAKDVKIQIEFNPAAVKAYRLIGYENRLLAKEDFNDDKKDAGEIGAGHTVTALYELIPAGAPDPAPVVDGLKYQQVPAVTTPPAAVTEAALTGELLTVKLRWKQPDGDTSELMEVPVKDSGTDLAGASEDTRWAAAVAAFGQLLRGDAPTALTWESLRTLARGAKGDDPLGNRGEFLQLVDKAEGLVPRGR